MNYDLLLKNARVVDPANGVTNIYASGAEGLRHWRETGTTAGIAFPISYADSGLVCATHKARYDTHMESSNSGRVGYPRGGPMGRSGNGYHRFFGWYGKEIISEYQLRASTSVGRGRRARAPAHPSRRGRARRDSVIGERRWHAHLWQRGARPEHRPRGRLR